MNPDLQLLHPYPFEKLKLLFKDIQPMLPTAINLGIGEPQHQAPDLALNTLKTTLSSINRYPSTKGSDILRESISQWLITRFKLDAVDPAHQILPVNGTREALFAFAQASINKKTQPIAILPNPFYQIYEGAILLAGAQPYYLNCTQEQNFLPDFSSIPEAIWQQCQLVYICNPGNPAGAIMPLSMQQTLITLAEKYNFIIAADECYSEIYQDTVPISLLQAAQAMGNSSYKNCVVFHSLSKRSNLPGLRSGFVAGDAEILNAFLLYRTYHGCAMSPTVQAASSAIWQDETHVMINRQLYQEKFTKVFEILKDIPNIQLPEAGFYFWIATPIKDTEFAQKLYQNYNITVLPGSYLAREHAGVNPGSHYIRMALVAPLKECITAAQAIKELFFKLI